MGLNRRSFMRTLGVLVVPGGSAALVTGCATGVYTGLTDRDPVDGVGYGRGAAGATDNDTGPYADPVGRGRGSGRSAVAATASGSGFFISLDGILITNHHIVEGRPHVSILRDGQTTPASIVAVDAANDIAILRVEGTSQALPMGTARDVRVGQDVFSMGFPLAALSGAELRANFGRVNALSGLNGDARYMQIDVPVQPGSSGGPLIGANGQVVGIITARMNDMAMLATTGALPENIGYAIKIDYLTPLLPQSVVLSTSSLSGSLEQRIESGRGAVVQVIANRDAPGVASSSTTTPATGVPPSTATPPAGGVPPSALSPPTPPPAPPVPPSNPQ